METTAMPTGIRPIERPQGPQTTGVQRRGTPSASPFAPRTDVSLQNSVADVANLLSKIASTKEEAMDKISPQIQKLIDSIMKQSFSLESTLAEGLGTTLESQRFAMDQMFTLGRMLMYMYSFGEYKGTLVPQRSALAVCLYRSYHFSGAAFYRYCGRISQRKEISGFPCDRRFGSTAKS